LRFEIEDASGKTNEGPQDSDTDQKIWDGLPVPQIQRLTNYSLLSEV